MITFFLIRHADKNSEFGNPDITNIGKRQAERTGKYLKNKKINLIYASTLARALQTAEIIAKQLDLNVQSDKRLTERMNWDQSDISWEEFSKEWARTDESRDYNPKFGDSDRNSGSRMKCFLNEIAKDNDGKNIIVIAHSGVIGDFLRNIFPDTSLPLTNVSWTKAKYLDLLECSISIVRKDENGFKLVDVGLVDHMSVLGS